MNKLICGVGVNDLPYRTEKMKPEKIEDFLEDKWLAERGVGYRMVVTEEQKGDDMSESSIK